MCEHIQLSQSVSTIEVRLRFAFNYLALNCVVCCLKLRDYCVNGTDCIVLSCMQIRELHSIEVMFGIVMNCIECCIASS